MADDNCHVALYCDWLDLRGRQPVERSTIRDRLNEIPASLRGVILELGVVHRGGSFSANFDTFAVGYGLLKLRPQSCQESGLRQLYFPGRLS